MVWIVHLPYVIDVLKDTYIVGLMNTIIVILHVVVENTVVHRIFNLEPEFLIDFLTLGLQNYSTTIRVQKVILRKFPKLIHGHILWIT